jgi:hypothetical protein
MRTFVYLHCLLPLALIAVIFSGCATGVNPTTLLAPSAIQADIRSGGALALPNVSASTKVAIHTFATDLAALSADQLTVAQVQAIIPSIPQNDQPWVSTVIDGGVIVIDAAISKFGEHNATTVAYAQAVGNGLLQAGF